MSSEPYPQAVSATSSTFRPFAAQLHLQRNHGGSGITDESEMLLVSERRKKDRRDLKGGSGESSETRTGKPRAPNDRLTLTGKEKKMKECGCYRLCLSATRLSSRCTFARTAATSDAPRATDHRENCTRSNEPDSREPIFVGLFSDAVVHPHLHYRSHHG